MSSKSYISNRSAGTDCRTRNGFTIVELVVVIAVIGILAAITVIGFGAWRVSVAETEVKNDLLSVQAGMEDARNRTDAYPVFTTGTQFNGTNSTRAIFKQSANVTITYSSGNATDYCITAQSTEESSVVMRIDISASSTPQAGSC